MLTEDQKSVLIGGLLGRYRIAINSSDKKKKATLSLEKSIDNLEYVEWSFEYFKDYCKSGLCFHSQAECCERINHLVRFGTKHIENFIEFYDKFYKKDIKTVPKDIKLDKLIIASWFGDNGKVIKSSKNNIKITFGAEKQRFFKNELSFLSKLLSERYNEKFVISKSVSKYSKTYYINGKHKAAVALLKDIDDVVKNFSKDRVIWEKYIK